MISFEIKDRRIPVFRPEGSPPKPVQSIQWKSFVKADEVVVTVEAREVQ